MYNMDEPGEHDAKCQTQKDKYSMVSLIYGIYKSLTYKIRVQ